MHMSREFMNVGALLVLKDREILPGPLLLHQGVLIAAGLGAGAPVGIPAGHIIGEQAPPGVADAHGPVDRRSRSPAPSESWPGSRAISVQAQLPGQHHPAGAQVVPGPGALVIARWTAWVEMWRSQRGAYFPARAKAPRSARIRASTPASVQELQVRRAGWSTSSFRGMVFTVQWTLTPVLVGEGHGLGQLLRGEIPGEGPHPEGGARQIHGVRPVERPPSAAAP